MQMLQVDGVSQCLRRWTPQATSLGMCVDIQRSLSVRVSVHVIIVVSSSWLHVIGGRIILAVPFWL
ncbi:hypothetical protein RY27_11295 [Litorilinea aerophila]|nr:hypothetical protein RY27_11295 [Litorilinea aerophila]